MELYQKFMNCGEKTWGRVIEALEGSDYDNIAKEVKEKIAKDYKDCK